MNVKTKRPRWLVLALTLGMGVALLVLILAGGHTRAGDRGGAALQSVCAQPAAAGGASTFAADPSSDAATLDLSGSSVETDDCYQADKTQTFCFTVYNGSTNGEWINGVTLTFPEDTSQGFPPWSVSGCTYEDPKDSQGYPVNFTCTPSGKQVFYTDTDGDGYGEISNGASWMMCVDVYVPSQYSVGGLRYIPWELYGDDGGSVTDERIKVEMCTPLRLMPSQVVITGCNGMAQSLEFELTDYDAGTVDLGYIYDAPEADFTGDGPLIIQQGEIVTFTAQFEPELCLEPGETVTASLTVIGGVHSDSSFITQTIAESDGWRRRADSDIPTMDNVVVWASHRDGGLWSIGGYGSDGAVQRYDPGSDTWQKGFESEAVITPLIEYPMDGCYGLDGPDPDTANEIVVLFPDTIVTDSLHVYDITADSWYTRPIPGFFPSNYVGHWGFDVVSLLNKRERPGYAFS
jgi:hypothetical protein